MLYYKKLNILGHEQISNQGLAFIRRRPIMYNRLQKVSLIGANFKEALEEIPSLSIFSSYGINITRVMFFVMHSQDNCHTHRDPGEQMFRINMPVLNCDGSKLEFWKDVEWVSWPNDAGYMVDVAKPGTGNLIDFVEIDRPTIISIKEAHNVILGNNVPRITLSMEFEIDRQMCESIGYKDIPTISGTDISVFNFLKCV